MAAPLNLGELARERMARRAAKERERSESPPALRGPRKAPRLMESAVALPSGARLTSFSTLVQQDQEGRKSDVANASNQRLRQQQTQRLPDEHGGNQLHTHRRPGDIIYPEGTVKKTWAFGHERDGSDIKLEEVLEPQTLRTAVLSAFQWDTDWVLSKLKVPPNGGSTKCVFVMQAKEQALREEKQAQTSDMRPWLRLCFPPMEGQINCMHSKLMLLFHPKKLRIAIPTANLLNFDWGETGVMENSVFMIDLPRLAEDTKIQPNGLTAFGQELMHFLQKQGLHQDIREGVLNFDFTATQRIAFVHTSGGKSMGDDAGRTALPGLGQAIRRLDLAADDTEIDFAASSIGNLKDQYLSMIHAATKGDSVFEHLAQISASAKSNFFSQNQQISFNIRDKIRIYFPMHDTVTSSKAGTTGTICLSREWYEKPTFPRRCFRDYISTRSGLLSHNKLLYVRGLRKDGQKVAWTYIGSANVSESAWGQVVYNKREKSWHVNCRNWECGVVLPVEIAKDDVPGEARAASLQDEGASVQKSHGGRLVPMSVFDEINKPPFRIPAPEYQGREPWYFKESS